MNRELQKLLCDIVVVLLIAVIKTKQKNENKKSSTKATTFFRIIETLFLFLLKYASIKNKINALPSIRSQHSLVLLPQKCTSQ